MTNESLIELLKFELAKPGYEASDYRSGLRKAIAIARQHQAGGLHCARCAAELIESDGGQSEFPVIDENTLADKIGCKLLNSLYPSIMHRSVAGLNNSIVLKVIEVFRPYLRSPEPVSVADYEAVLTDHRRLVRELDVALNGEDAAPQASLCDIVAQVKATKREARQPEERRAENGTGVQESGATRAETEQPGECTYRLGDFGYQTGDCDHKTQDIDVGDHFGKIQVHGDDAPLIAARIISLLQCTPEREAVAQVAVQKAEAVAVMKQAMAERQFYSTWDEMTQESGVEEAVAWIDLDECCDALLERFELRRRG